MAGTHYKELAIQPAVFSERNGLSFLEGDVVKRLCRHRHPDGGGATDIKKAIHELQILLKLVYDEEAG